MAMLEFDKIERTSVASQVYEHIKHSILHGSLPPGTHLAEPQIAAQMGVSRSPIREALRLLEADGLIEIRPGQGAFVKGLTAEEIQEIYTARTLIEGYAAELASQKATPADLERLRNALHAVNEAAQREDYEATVMADFDLHRLIWEISDHQVLVHILSRLEVQIRMFMAVQAPLFEHLYDSVKSHRQVVEAIAAGDGAAARASIQHHIDEAGILTLRQLDETVNEEDREPA